MIEITSNEGLMVWLMHKLADFGGKAVLKGGMTLRLLDCPRFTNDLDYVFVGFKSKKEIVPILEKIVSELSGAKATVTLHSTSARLLIHYKNFKTQIEADILPKCKTQPMSTGALAKPNNQLPRIISVMSFDVALAHKLAAWNERSLMRDLYDIYFLFAVLDVLPDTEVLKSRLKNINYSGKGKLKNQSKKMSLGEFFEKLLQAVKVLSPQSVETELRDYLESTELAGIVPKMKSGIKKLIEVSSKKS